ESITLKEKMVTRVTDQGIMIKPRQLPGVPALAFPDDGAIYTFQRKVPRAEMRWKGVESARRYRVVVATDPSFKKVFADEKVDGQKVAVGPDGSFLCPVALKEGVNPVTVEAIDPAGNSEYGKRMIFYKGAKRSSAAAVSPNR